MEGSIDILASKDVMFICKKEAQKNLIEIMLQYSNLDLRSLADILDTNPLLLSHVVRGKDNLDKRAFKRLIEWFFILING